MAAAPFMNARRILILLHRYLGIPLSVVFVVWFVSGIVMMYTGGMPSLSEAERLARTPPIALGQVTLTAAAAAERAGFARAPGSVSLEPVLGRPAYRFGGFRGPTTVFADSGRVLEPVDAERARTVAAAFTGMPLDAVTFTQTVTEPDQWTLTQRGSLPLHELAVADGAGTRVYVSERAGSVELVTSRASRALAWAGAIPHWFYFTPLRLDQPLWYWTVVWASVLGCVLAVLGLTLGVTQFRRSKPFRLSASVRYRGWMRWHYLGGVLFGLFALTWVFSGLMSMEPFDWTRASGLEIPQDALTGGALELEDYENLDPARWHALLGGAAAKRIDFARIQGDPYFVVRYTAGETAAGEPRGRQHQPYPLAAGAARDELLVDARTLEVRREPFSTASLIERLENATHVPIASHELLSEYDAYYYSRGDGAPLPVLRVEFGDPARSWYYVDPARSEIVARTHRGSRIERWLFNGLHSLDFAFWYDKRPLWDIGMILLSLGALTTSLIGMCLGFKRLGLGRSRETREERAEQFEH